MFALIAAFAATSYVMTVVLMAIATLAALSKPFAEEIAFVRNIRIILDILASLVAEIPLHLLALKLLKIKVASFFGAFNYTVAWLAYFIDVACIAGLVLLFIESMREQEVVEEAIKDLTGGEPADPVESILSVPYIKRVFNFFWSPEDVILHPNITYATNEESAEAIASTNDYDQPRRMALDIFKWSKAPANAGLRPVVVHIHGGAWTMGDKDCFYPYQKMLIEEDNWIVVNIGYRLAPKNPYPIHLIDIKRSLRWIKRTIRMFGGDPDFIVLSGDSAGGHLASMAAITANDPQYQPGFEDVDTSVKGVISINGSLDLLNDPAYADWFSTKVAMKGKVDVDLLRAHSPAEAVLQCKDKAMAPHLLISGERDCIVDVSQSERFKSAYDEAAGEKNSQCTLLKLPGAHHVCHMSWSPRAFYLSRMIQVWCKHIYAKGK
ncbi:esterase lipase [Lichtheimia corymbifera JMRC:FSU:9682]|uniref:Esterase lipase n=1 Tax=Lichtheimia corymbifera JMRC:FSU:9682 TaxID=1263082 RepID=A0A068RKA5_9FUNG|nr:esterase lipase [Lichtheimia corymbifera JMRC:FSU:9682]